MAVLYKTFIQNLMEGNESLDPTQNFSVYFLSAAYTADTGIAGHDTTADLTGILAIEPLSNVTITDRKFIADTPVTVTDPGSGTATQIVISNDDTNALIYHDSTATGLPITFDGTNDVLNLGAHIFQIGPA